MIFLTGAEELPPGGFGCFVRPCLNFSDEQPYPTASTCSISMTLPTKYRGNYYLFKRAMDVAMTCHGGFGLV